MSVADTDVVDWASDGELPDVREAAIRPFAHPGRRYWIAVTLLSLIVAVGLVSWVAQLNSGLGIAGYNNHAFWAVYIADVVTFIGVSYGGAVISAVLRLTGADWRAPLTRLAEGMAVVTVIIGGAFIIPHLGRPDRIWELVTRPNLSSPIFWDFIAISTYTFGSIVFFCLPLVPDMAILHRSMPERLGRRNRLYGALSRGWTGMPGQRRTLHRSMTLVAILIIPLAVSVHSVLSWAFSLVSRPWWHDSIWAPYFVVAALYSGVALVILVVAAFRRAYHLEKLITPRHFVRLGFIMAAFAATYLYLTFADILPDAYVGDHDSAAVFHELLVGAYAPWFWMFVVAAGIVPLLIVAIPRTRTVAGMVVAAALIVPAMWLKRIIMVLDPATFDRVTSAFGSYHFTWVSVSITLAGVAAIPLLLMLLFRVVPLVSVDEMEEVEATRRNGAADAAADLWRERPPVVMPRVHPDRSGAAGRMTIIGAVALAVVMGGALIGLMTAPPVRAAPTPISYADNAGRVSAHAALAATDTAQGVRLVATLTSTGGSPVGQAHVAFYERTTVFGPAGQLAPLGSATTDATGTARLIYRPSVTGTQQFVVRYTGGGTAGSATATVTVAVTTAFATYHPAPPKPLADVGNALLIVLVATVALIWITLAAQLVRVVRACRHGDA